MRGLKGLGVPFVLLLVAVYLGTAPGRIVFPDDEIVFQTTRSLWEDGSLAIEGIPRRTGEPRGQPDGTFGWAEGVDGRRYGFFGHGLSIVALPMYGLGKAASRTLPETWRHTIRSDHFFLHRRSATEDLTRLFVSLTNVGLTALAAWMLVLWTGLLGFSRAIAIATGLTYGLATTAWPYTRTFLSEPLSALVLLSSAVCTARYHASRSGPGATHGTSWLWLAGLLAGLSVHVHILNLLTLPALAVYAFVPLVREGVALRERRAISGALLLGAVGLVLLGWSQWARFGDPFESGRYGLYSHFIVPGEGLAAMLVAPGRSIFVYSPPLLLALLGWTRLWRRAPEATAACALLVLMRLLFVACRSDWWGGWALGPRLLVPAVPFALLPIAAVFSRWREASKLFRFCVAAVLCISLLLQAHLAVHSIFEWMLRVYAQDSPAMSYLTRSHWLWSMSPIAGFFEVRADVLFVGAMALQRLGHPGPLVVFAGVVLMGLAAALMLGARLGLRRRQPGT